MSKFAGRTCDLMEGGACWSSLVLQDYTLWKRPTFFKFRLQCFHWEGFPAGAGEECEEEGVAEMTCSELITTPISRPPVLQGRRR